MNLIGGVLVGFGVLLCVAAGIGLLRFPDTLTRANAATKAAGLGVACVFLGVAFVFNTPEAWWKMAVAIGLQFATAPVAGRLPVGIASGVQHPRGRPEGPRRTVRSPPGQGH